MRTSIRATIDIMASDKSVKLSDFGRKLASGSGINELMDDLGKSLNEDKSMLMLGGGNPAAVPEVLEKLRRQMIEICASKTRFKNLIGDYDTPQGNREFIVSLTRMFNKKYKWGLKPENVAITNGSQSACFFIFNMLAGHRSGAKKGKVLFPLVPEYIGYSDQGIEKGSFVAVKPSLEILAPHEFKYHIDFNALKLDSSIRLMCVSRPTNPSGNVITDEEILHLQKLASQKGIYLLVDNAYGAPFPDIVFNTVQPTWNERTILMFSLSKLGLPATRTGIVIADEKIISALSEINAVISLATGSVGAGLVLDWVKDGSIMKMSRQIIKPFYHERSLNAIAAFKKAMNDDLPYFIHQCEGSMFLWLWFKGLPISSSELYRRLKKRKVLVVSGHYFFPGFTRNWKHRHECIRVNYAQDPAVVRKGLNIIAEEVCRAYAKS